MTNDQANNRLVLREEDIKSKIYTIRNVQVMIDSDPAELYGVETKVLNQDVKRNIESEEFMFRLTKEEFKNLKFHSGISSLRSQIVTSSWGGRIAVRVSIQIMAAFIAMRKFISSNAQIFHRLYFVEKKQIEHDKKFDQIFDACKFVSDIIKSANNSIILIDNFINDLVLTLFNNRKKGVEVIIFTKDISKQPATTNRQ